MGLSAEHKLQAVLITAGSVMRVFPFVSGRPCGPFTDCLIIYTFQKAFQVHIVDFCNSTGKPFMNQSHS